MGDVDVATLIKQRLKNDVRAFAAAEVSEITVQANFFLCICRFAGSMLPPKGQRKKT